MITVFTPTYNRAYTLPKLYHSLLEQTCKDFEWLIVDDGSTDETEQLISNLIIERDTTSSQFPIRYIKQANGGKHRAINKGVEEAKGELFFIVDSDDYLTSDAVEWVSKTAEPIICDDSFAGLSGIRVHPDMTKIGSKKNFGTIDATSSEIRGIYHVTGDLAEIYKTDVLKKFPFPDIPGEKFCSEGLIWRRIARSGLKLRYIYYKIYVCEYLNDGLTEGKFRLRRDNPEYSMLLDSEGVKGNALFYDKVRQAINFWRYSENSKKTFVQKCNQIGWVYIWCYPLGVFFRHIKI